MTGYLKRALVVAALAVSLANIAPVFAQPGDRNSNSPGLGWGPPSTRGAPGPLAAAGLPFLIAIGAAGAYKWIRKRQVEKGQQPESGSRE